MDLNAPAKALTAPSIGVSNIDTSQSGDSLVTTTITRRPSERSSENDVEMLSSSNERQHLKDDYLEMARTTTGSGVVYKLYRRRWAGLAILMSMNMVISWGVRD